MAQKTAILFALLLSASAVSAWSDYSDQFFCDNAVKNVWGGKVYDECLGALDGRYQDEFCGLLLGDKRDRCLAIKGVVHPSELPNIIGEGYLEHPGACPITKYPARSYLCATKSKAIERAAFWMNWSLNAQDRCGRIYRFCIASNYLAQAYNPFNFVTGRDDACRDRMDKKIDFDISINQSQWGVTETCIFEYEQGKVGEGVKSFFTQSMTINDRNVESVLLNLSATARGIFTKPLHKPMGIPTTSTTLPGPRPVSKTYCDSDSDCVAVEADCCGCTGGGENIAITRNYTTLWEREIGRKCKDSACPAVMSQDISCFSSAVCNNNACELKPNTALLCLSDGLVSNCAGAAPNPVRNESGEYGASCGYINYICQAPVAVTSTTATTTTQTTETTVTSTTLAAVPVPTTMPAPTTTVPVAREAGWGLWIYAVLLLVVIVVTYLLLGNAGQRTEDGQRRGGLMGLGGSGAKISSYGTSRLTEADRLRGMRPKEQTAEHPSETKPAQQPKERAEEQPVPRKGIASLLKENRDGTKLGEK